MRTPIILALLLTSAIAGAAEQTRSMPAFNSISVQGPINMTVEAGKAQTLLLKGDDSFLKRVLTKVVNGKLVITFLNRLLKNHSPVGKFLKCSVKMFRI